MKINCHGMELETITEGYWPEGVTMVLHDGKITSREVRNVVCLRSGSVLCANGYFLTGWRFWAIIPPKPAPRRLTNRETYGLWRKGYDFQSNCGTIMEPSYAFECEGNETEEGAKLRAPNTDEWLEPTIDLLEVWDNAV